MLISYYQRHVFPWSSNGCRPLWFVLMCYRVLCLESISHLFQILQPMHFHGWLICDRRHLFKLMIFYFISVLVMSWLLCSFVTRVLVLLFALYFFFWWMGSPFLPFKNKNKNNIYIYIHNVFSSYLVITKCITENNSTHIQHLALLKYVSHSRLFIILQFPKPHPISLTWVVDPRPVLHPWLSLTQGYGHKWREEEPTFQYPQQNLHCPCVVYCILG
jgi:hypothetical protein